MSGVLLRVRVRVRVRVGADTTGVAFDNYSIYTCLTVRDAISSVHRAMSYSRERSLTLPPCYRHAAVRLHVVLGSMPPMMH